MLKLPATIKNLVAPSGEIMRFTFQMPTNVTRLEAALSEGTGDADLYVRYQLPPTLTDFDERPYVAGNEERVVIDSPRTGLWHLAVHAAQAFSNVTLTIKAPARQPAGALDFRSPRDIELAMYYELAKVEGRDEIRDAELRNRALRDEGRTAFSAGQFDRAEEAWKRWSELDPSNPEPISLIGDIYLRKRDIQRAVEFYKQSLDIQPGQIALVVRLARLLDEELKQPVEARNLLNLYSRLFPTSADIALAQAEWLLRRKRYDEAADLIRAVIDADWENLRARSLLHGLLKTPEERYANMLAMLSVGQKPGLEALLAQAITDNSLLSRPESWVLMGFVEQMAVEGPYEDLRQFCAGLLPRREPAYEDFRLGRVSRNWISSRELMWNEEGQAVLTADISQTEAYLRLVGSDALHSGFIEATIDQTRGFFWLYARRGEGAMIRFGFDEKGLMYQQIWMNGQLRFNESRLWSKPPGVVTLRLETRADGVYSFIDGKPAFGAPMTIPRDMGLGWWGLAPWSPEFGAAAVAVQRVAGGPLVSRLGLLETQRIDWSEPRIIVRLQRLMGRLQAFAPDWYERDGDTLKRRDAPYLTELRLLTRFYRARLMPSLFFAEFMSLDRASLERFAEGEGLDGFTLMAEKMPPARYCAELESFAIKTGLCLLILVPEPGRRAMLAYEICPGVGLLPAPRRARRLPVSDLLAEPPAGAEGTVVFVE